MKQLNGTVTLSFLEEDNQQRVIFRVIPLCTREGTVFRTPAADFPDQGSLRIVPDKREQSTFKERMREMGCLCAIQLISDGRELTKVRQNRNYNPAQGENNQFAIYSDVICEFTGEGIFEVFDEGADYSAALSPRVLLRRGKVLYGPLEKEKGADWSLLRPFGNDCYLLHTVSLPDGAERSFYWNPEQTLNWRQRRGAFRRGKTHAEDEQETAVRPPVTTVRPPAAAVIRAATDAVVTAAPAPAPTYAPIPAPVAPATIHRPAAPVVPPEREQPAAADETLPIGTKLEILDEGISFDEQISKLDQPLSNDANLLTHSNAPIEAPEPKEPLHINGTPLVRFGAKMPRGINHGETFHNVVEHQIRAAHQEPGEYATDFQHVDNPIEDLSSALEKVWDLPDTQRQALELLCGNETFTQAFLQQLRLRGREMKAVQAAQEQLEDIEAERLGLLMQLEAMKNDEKTAREALYTGLVQKKREEIAALEARANTLKAETESLTNALRALSGAAQERTLETLMENGARLCACGGDTVAVAPVIGVKRSPEEMIASVRAAMNRRGFVLNEDDAAELLMHFALDDAFYLQAPTPAAAELCARAMLEGLGLACVSAFTGAHERLAVASLLPDDEMRTPTVEVGPAGRENACLYGHKTIRLTGPREEPPANAALPLVSAPPLKTNVNEDESATPVPPVSLESLQALKREAVALMPQAEAWFTEMGGLLAKQGLSLEEPQSRFMRAFISVASARLRGGFLAAADAAMIGWVVPSLLGSTVHLETLRPALESLPRTVAALGIR